jgi:hypothetical protein
MTTRARTLAAIIAGTAIVGLVAGPALADAPSKEPSYHWESAGAAGVEAGIADLGSSESATTSDDGGASSSTASANTVGSSASCDAPAREHGNSRDEQASTLLDLGEVRVLSASCDAHRVGDNTSHATAESSIVTVDAADTSITVGRTTSSSQSTSGQTRTTSSVAIVAVGDTAVVECTSTSSETSGGASDSESVNVLGESVADDCPLAESSSSGSSDNPSAAS